jgi:protein-S-isoprenylcysteine O-methyltransferase Ste14
LTGTEAEPARPSDSLLVRLGNVVFRVRDGLFPAVLVLLFVLTNPELAGNSHRGDDILDVVGLLVALIGQVLRVAVVGTVYVIRGGRNRKVYAEELVSGGFFAHCRNPLYVGNLLVLLGLFIVWNSPVAYLVGVPFFLIAYSAIVAAEERFLREKFGEPFDEYRARVPRWIPRFRGLRASLAGMRFHWQRVVIKEYGSTAAWMAGAAVLLLGDSLAHQPWSARPAYHAACVAALPVIAVAWGTARWLKKTKRLQDD